MKPFLRIALAVSIAAAFAGCKTTGDDAQAAAATPTVTTASAVDNAPDAYTRQNAI